LDFVILDEFVWCPSHGGWPPALALDSQAAHGFVNLGAGLKLMASNFTVV
jgi:hypothetical protein